MINVKKGSAHSLQQTDKLGVVSGTIIAGALVSFDHATDVANATDASKIVGFAINNSTDSDVIGAGNKLGGYLLDGGSIIETDQFDAAIIKGDTIGVGTGGTAGKAVVWTTGPVVGICVEKGNALMGSTTTSVIAIKLKA